MRSLKWGLSVIVVVVANRDKMFSLLQGAQSEFNHRSNFFQSDTAAPHQKQT